MTNPAPQTLAPMPAPLLDRVVVILEEARGQVVRAVNTQMVWAYWLIGREIVQALQGGDERAAYGQQVLSEVSRQLTQRYGKGFSLANLQNFRKFYLAYSARAVPAAPIQYPAGRELAGSESVQGFSPQLTWSHYRALMRVDNVQARDFYEREAIECGWSKVQLERQIHSFYFERIVAHRGAQGVLPAGRERLPGQPVPAAQVLKSPLVLEFLGLPDTPNLHESKLEQAIINNLQTFLLELGKGFSFVARQYRITINNTHYRVDLVFYHRILRCFVLIDLKLGDVQHHDIGQMNLYLGYFANEENTAGDQPPIGIILSRHKDELLVEYATYGMNSQLFVQQYQLYLPDREELRRELENTLRTTEPEDGETSP